MNFTKDKKILYAFCILFVSNIFIWSVEFDKRPKNLEVSFLDVSQGDSIYIKSPTGNTMVIDTGSGNRFLSEISSVKGIFDKRIDALLITHHDLDHAGGVTDIVDRFSLGVFADNGIDVEGERDNKLRNLVEEKGIPVVTLSRGDIVDFGDGVFFEVLYPEKGMKGETNDTSIVGILSYGSKSFVLTGDAPISVEQFLLRKGDNLKAQVLKAGHHGSRTSSSLSFIKSIDPEFVIISAGENNSYGHPHKEVLNTIASAGASVFGTYQKGAIIFETDGAFLKIRD